MHNFRSVMNVVCLLNSGTLVITGRQRRCFCAFHFSSLRLQWFILLVRTTAAIHDKTLSHDVTSFRWQEDDFGSRSGEICGCACGALACTLFLLLCCSHRRPHLRLYSTSHPSTSIRQGPPTQFGKREFGHAKLWKRQIVEKGTARAVCSALLNPSSMHMYTTGIRTLAASQAQGCHLIFARSCLRSSPVET